MDNTYPKCAFLVPFFGKLPDYFDHWAESCRINHGLFHWFVYNDHINVRMEVNPSVTMIPYRFDEMVADFRDRLQIYIHGSTRNVCDYRMLFYFLRRHREPLDDYDFIGYTDMDMVYGRLAKFLPSDMRVYSMITADNDEPCGPFTLIRREYLRFLIDEDVKKIMESENHLKLNEDRKLIELISRERPAFCHASPLQPARTKPFHIRQNYCIWDHGNVTVYDIRGNRMEGGFYHFSRYKQKRLFNVRKQLLQSSAYGICKLGFFPIRSKYSEYILKFSLLF